MSDLTPPTHVMFICTYLGLAEKVYVVEKRGYKAEKIVGLLLNSQI